MTRAHDSIGISELDVPWWTYRAIDAVESGWPVGTAMCGVFEWGSGASTIWLARRVASVRSVEHHGGFGTMIQEQLTAWPTAQLDIVEPVPTILPMISSAKEGHGRLDFTDYVHHIDTVDGPFGLIVIDGRPREAVRQRRSTASSRRDHRLRQHAAAPVPAGDRRRSGRREGLPRADADAPLPRPDSILHRR